MKPVYVLGGMQSDFARNWAREGHKLFDVFRDTVLAGLEQTRLEPAEIEVGHVGNFVAIMFTGQSHLGGFFGHVHPDLANLPASRHEAACASGSMALFGAMADIESGRYDLACVLGIEMMRNVPGDQGAANMRGAGWVDREAIDTPFVWPCAFSQLIDTYGERHGIDKTHLAAISEQNFANARRNPNAQTRRWDFAAGSFSENDELNPPIIGNIRKLDCGQITDGAAVLFLAGEEKAREYAAKRDVDINSIPRIKGWGHCNAPMLLEEKLRLSQDADLVFPHIRDLFDQALGRAGMSSFEELDGLEVHDCFNITEYMVVDHVGLYAPGEAWKAVENGDIAPGGRLPVNASGGLIGLGHPVGATGVRMALDCYKQVTGTAGDYQIDAARNMMTFNLGGSATTCASLVIGR